ncbi:putative dpy-30 domain-containing protein [Golovinomyces cichoracearum]|uniref:Putative dpy-30 domain-containing protein n=1 Tax=Golovinomyces cichoracearum TaxID=62708 RepID=A0A420IX36_9PEZI|nr:putative dpy-30 domain-containing protein [Golovinomyces cichoracearum]
MAEQKDSCQDILALPQDNESKEVSPASSNSSSPTSKSPPIATYTTNNQDTHINISQAHPPLATPFAAPLLEGWPPAATISIPESVSNPTISEPKSKPALDLDSVVDEDVIMTDNEPVLANFTDEMPLSMDAFPEVDTTERGSAHEVVTKVKKVVLKTTSSVPVATDSSETKNNNITSAPCTPSPDVPVTELASPRIIAARTNSTLPTRNATTSENSKIEKSLNSVISTRSSSQHLDNTTSATSISGMPEEAPSHGAPTRKYLNENVTGVLLEGLKIIVKERPSNPLRALGEYLIQKSKEIN